jgi:rubredoxin---NAD+ reductase
MNDPIVIIGSGLAGYTLAREFRKRDRGAPLTVVTRDAGHFYSKPMLSASFAAGKSPDDLAQASAQKMAADLEAEILTETEVSALDTGNREFRVEGRNRSYSRLVLALGADPGIPALTGNAVGEVMTVNDLPDYRRFRTRLNGKKRVAIIGAGLIGCEFANDLICHGFDVAAIDPAVSPLGRLLPPMIGAALADALQAKGVEWHLGVAPASVDYIDDASRTRLRLGFANGAFTEADVVLSAIGLRPRTALAAAAGIETGRGIKVDRLLESSAPGVYALGDCAEVEALNLPFVMPLMHAARALAATLSGTRTMLRYPSMPVVVKTPALPLVVAPPTPPCGGEWHIAGNGRDLAGRFLDAAGNLKGFALCGEAVKEKHQLAAALDHWLA